MSSSLLIRQKDESLDDYLIRLCDNKEVYGINKYKIAELLNAEKGMEYSESKWRKDYASYLRWSNYTLNKKLDKDILHKYEEKRTLAEKATIRMQDQKRELKKLIRNQGRFEKIEKDIYEAILRFESKKPLKFNYSKSKADSKKHGLALLSDWHFGMEVNSTINTFNKQVFNERVEHLTKKIIEHGRKNNISTLHVANLGDMVSGLIHVSARVQANEDVVEQVQYVSETLAEMLDCLSRYFKSIKFYSVAGNHGRISPSKNDVGIKENFEYLFPWYLRARLRDHKNIEIVKERDGYIEANILNEKVVFVHGNYDKPDQCVNKFPQMLGYVPDHIFSGHIHHNYEREFGVTTSIVNGSLIGADDYAVQGRYGARPSQKFIVFDEDEGLEATYIIKLHKVGKSA